MRRSIGVALNKLGVGGIKESEMKKIVSTMLLAIVLLAFSACNLNTPLSSTDNPLDNAPAENTKTETDKLEEEKIVSLSYGFINSLMVDSNFLAKNDELHEENKNNVGKLIFTEDNQLGIKVIRLEGHVEFVLNGLVLKDGSIYYGNMEMGKNTNYNSELQGHIVVNKNSKVYDLEFALGGSGQKDDKDVYILNGKKVETANHENQNDN